MGLSKRFWGAIQGMFHGGVIGTLSCLTRLTWSPGLVLLFAFFGGLEGLVDGNDAVQSMWSRTNFYRDANVAHQGRVVNNLMQEEILRRKLMESKYRPYGY